MAKKGARKVSTQGAGGATFRLLADVPVGEGYASKTDGLRFEQYAGILAQTAIDTPEPFTIGVYGGWGSGKTSVMRLMEKHIQGLENVSAIPIWFNAWRYEKEEHLIVPLLATILTEMEKHKSLLEKMTTNFTKLRDAFRSVLYGVSVKGKIKVPGITEAELSISPKDMVERYEKLSEMAAEQILSQSLYFQSFSKLDELSGEIAAAEGEEPLKLIIFVDDLDRCFPDRAVMLLENIKLVLNQPNISFVLGIAPDIITAYLKAKYSKDYGIPEKLYEDYLDKLVQLPFVIPDIKKDIEGFARSLLRNEDVFGSIPDEEFKDNYEPLIAICGPACMNNPRAIIRFLNRLLMLKRVHDAGNAAKKPGEDKQTISLVHFGITNALEMKWPDVLSACELNRDISNMETNQDGAMFPLCKLLANILKRETPEIHTALELFDKEENRERKVFQQMISDSSLRELLGSKAGIEWLEEPELRKEATIVSHEMATPEPESKARRRYEVPWAEGYSESGWPIMHGVEIAPESDMSQAQLNGAMLIGADMSRAYLRGASLMGANLRGASLMELT